MSKTIAKLQLQKNRELKSRDWPMTRQMPNGLQQELKFLLNGKSKLSNMRLQEKIDMSKSDWKQLQATLQEKNRSGKLDS